ncbi:hypothetical protein [Citreimonas salinaria]|uniref:Uncharacterized protein n=1 Tax=Citreimonas salinaria TaxID=321339 RepID=A0A1H3IQS6_9RHOB|nr:hypothetical protein [Citreimonas salinaria]SDY29619.1 hypothetical protein SAMN05444340_105197 [Citreimonas salinaria]
MVKRTKRYAATNENLLKYALAPTMRWLIAAALDGSTMTYGAVKARLETEEGFSTVFATRIGLVAGALMHRIQKADPAAPLINVLVVNQQDQMPSEGAGPFMARRFKNENLIRTDYKQRHPAKWREYFDRAAAEVYAASAEEWALLYQKVFDTSLPQDWIAAERDKRHNGNEDDFGAGGRKYGPGGEGELHKSLRLWVTANPEKLRRSCKGARSETEVCLDSGDRIDVVYHLVDRTIVLEVKSRISNDVDLRRGVYQCIKYRAVKAAMDVRENVPVEAILVTEGKPSGEIMALLRQHDIRHFNAPLVRD